MFDTLINSKRRYWSYKNANGPACTLKNNLAHWWTFDNVGTTLDGLLPWQQAYGGGLGYDQAGKKGAQASPSQEWKVFDSSASGQDYTFAFWMDVSRPHVYEVDVGRGQAGSIGINFWSLVRFSANALTMFVLDLDPSYVWRGTSSIPFTGTSLFCVMKWHQALKKMVLSVNAVDVAEITLVTALPGGSVDGVGIRHPNVGSAWTPIDKHPDEMAIWTGRVITQVEIDWLYNGGLGRSGNEVKYGDCTTIPDPTGILASLAAWWDMDGTLYDVHAGYEMTGTATFPDATGTGKRADNSTALSTATLPPALLTKNWTIGGVFTRTTNTAGQTFLCSRSTAGAGYERIAMWLLNSSAIPRIEVNSQGTPVYAQGVATAAGERFQAIATYDGVNLKFYQNGLLISSTPCTVNIDAGATYFQLGYEYTGNYTIDHDEVFIANNALTAAQIAYLWNGGQPIRYKDLYFADQAWNFASDGGWYTPTTSKDGLVWPAHSNISPLYLREIAANETIAVSVTGSGAMMKSIDRGLSWYQVAIGSVFSSIISMEAGDGKLVAIGSPGGSGNVGYIYVSEDGGDTWEYRLTNTSNPRSMKFYNGLWLMSCDYSGGIYSSTDLRNWTLRLAGAFYGMQRNATHWIAGNASTPAIAMSENGITGWTSVPVAYLRYYVQNLYAKDNYIIAGSYIASYFGLVKSIDNGATWTQKLYVDASFWEEPRGRGDIIVFGPARSGDAGETWTMIGGGSGSIGLAIVGPSVETPITFVTETQIWIDGIVALGGTLSMQEQMWGDALIRAIQASTFNSKIKWLAPFIGTSIAAHRMPLRDSYPVGAMINTGFVDADCTNMGIANPTEAAKILNTQMGAVNLNTGGKGGLGWWERAIGYGSGVEPIGCYTAGYRYVIDLRNTFRSWRWGTVSNSAATESVAAGNAHFYGQTSATNDHKLYVNATNVASNTNVMDTTPAPFETAIHIMGCYVGGQGPVYWKGRGAVAYLTDGTLTPTEITDFHTLLNTYLIVPTGR